MNNTLPRPFGGEPAKEPQIAALMSKLGDAIDRATETQEVLIKRLSPVLIPVCNDLDCEGKPECALERISPLAERVDLFIRRVSLLDEVNQALISRLGI
jgi:hypothetical protein